MADDRMLEFAEAEVKRLQAELEKTPAYKRLMAARELIAAYRGNPEVEASPRESTAAIVERVVTPIIEQHKTKTAQVDAAVSVYLKQKGARATSGELLPIVTGAGIEITGKIPSKTLASYLSTSKKFDNAYDGYGLVEWGGRRTAPPPPANEVNPNGGKMPWNS
jgi:hypothetical protein